MSENQLVNTKRDFKKLLSVDATPEKAATHYFTAKKFHQEKGKEEVGRQTPITDLIAAQRQLNEIINTLKSTRLSMAEWDSENLTKWEQIKNKELQLRESIQHFNQFVAENHEKRERAKAKIAKEREIQASLKQEIREVGSKVEYLDTIEKNLNDKVIEYQVYKNYLVQVAEKNKSLTDTQQVLKRYETLSATRSLLSQQQSDALNNVQTTRENLAVKAEEQASNMMGLTTELAQLRVKLENAEKKRHKWETTLSQVQRFTAEKTEEIERVRSSCWELYKTLTKLRKEPALIAMNDTEEQLVYITRRNKELLQVVNMIKSKEEIKGPLTNANVVTSSFN